MRVFSSLRARIATGIVVFAVLMIGAHSIIVWIASHRLEEGLLEQVAIDELDYVIARYRIDPSRALPESEFIKAYVLPRGASEQELPAHLRGLSEGSGEVFVGDSERHIAVRDAPEGRFIVSYRVDHVEARERRFLAFLYIAMAVAALIALAVGYLVGGHLVRPVRDLAARVGNLDTGPLAAPMAEQYRDEEILRLARAFDGYVDKVAQFVNREREFTANVSHEIRTPVTAIRTSCELLLEDPALSANARQRIEAIDRAAARLGSNTRSLLYLARAADAEQPEQVAVSECVDESAEAVGTVLQQKGIAFENCVDESAVIRTDRAALMIVMENLLRNAASYTQHGFVRVSYRDGCLSVEDSGPGIDAGELPRIAERFYRGGQKGSAEGMGLGLAIVKRICERFGWRFEIASTMGIGTRVSMFIPIPPADDVTASPTQS